MTVHHAALLAGLFLVPLLALVLSHRLLRRSRRARSAFWGLLAGHSLTALLATVAVLYLPVRWDADDVGRGLLGFWGMLRGGLVGGTMGWVRGGRVRSEE